jgi:UDP-N-acetylglucosamine 2-epimerase (non-hydrolysing)
MRRIVIHLVAGARPNFMKVAPLFHALSKETWCRPVIVHTGQHYDAEMSEAFFRDLGLPGPDHNLGVGSGSHAEQTAAVMIAYECLSLAERPDWVVVVGDVNSTMAVAITAKKLCLPVAHLEGGLRSFDRTMPEEINRLLTDSISDLLWTPSSDADENLAREGVPAERIVRVGNIMIDSLEMLRPRIEAARHEQRRNFQSQQYGIITLHRPANVEDRTVLAAAVSRIREVASRLPLVFPVHPRTRERLAQFGLLEHLSACPGIRLLPPLSYIEFMSLVFGASVVITDSGGVQEETSYLGIPCVTLRPNTERPITVTQGTNRLSSIGALREAVDAALADASGRGRPPELWDGCTAARVVASLRRTLAM